MTAFAETLVGLVGPAVQVSDEQLFRLERHFAALRRWNQKLNLTAVRNDAEAIERHYAESVYFAHVLAQEWAEPMTAADIGSGAGFPGFVLAVMQPNWTVTLVESHRRKAVFLSESSREQANVRVVAGRAEDIQNSFDLLVSRAVRPEQVLALMPALAFTVALLVTDEQEPLLASAGLTWTRRAPLPWAPQRLVVVGRST